MMLDVMFCTLTVIVTQGVLRSIIVALTVSITNPILSIVAAIGVCYMVWIMRMGKDCMGNS